MAGCGHLFSLGKQASSCLCCDFEPDPGSYGCQAASCILSQEMLTAAPGLWWRDGGLEEIGVIQGGPFFPHACLTGDIVPVSCASYRTNIGAFEIGSTTCFLTLPSYFLSLCFLLDLL